MEVVLLIIVFVIYIIFSYKNKIKIIKKYKSDINELNETIERYQIQMHETKNQFLLISTMLNSDKESTNNYITNIVKNEFEPNEAIQFKTRNIPINSLKSLVYNKIVRANNNDIYVDVFIDSKIKKINLSKITINDEYDLTRIIGVFFDNAIEECVEKKFKKISFSMMINKNYLIIEISNPINTVVDKNKIFEKGYTTKSNGHGYGLVLVKKILGRNKKFKHDLSIFDDCLIQRINIKRQ